MENLITGIDKVMDEQKEVLCDKLESSECENANNKEDTPKLDAGSNDKPENTEPQVAVCNFDIPKETVENNTETLQENTKQESPDQNHETTGEQHLPQSVDDKNLAENAPTEEKVQQPET